MALTKIPGSLITDTSIASGSIADDAITSAKVADDAITSGKIADNAITSGKIASNAVTSAKVLAGATGPQITAISGILAPDTAGNITITGAGFSSSNVFIDTGSTTALTAATSVTNTSSTSLTAAMPALSAGTYKVFVVNSDGKSAMFPQGFLVSASPTWSTSAGALTGAISGTSYSATVAASSDSAITYSVASGALPSGISLNTSTGAITGTAPSDSSTTTYNFTLRATDAESQTADRAFSISNLAVTKSYIFTGGSLPSGITHSRTESSSTVASYYNSNGYLAFASAGDERFTHAWNGSSAVAQGILLEEQRQNWFWDSETPLQNNFAAFSHTSTRSTVTNQTLPTGSTGNCTSYSVASGSGTYAGQYHTQWGSEGSGWYSYSFYGKRTSGNAGVRIRVYNGSDYYMRATFKFTDGTVNNITGECEAEMEALPNGWYRCKLSGYTSSNATGSPAHFTFEVGSEDYGAQTTSGSFTASQFYFWGFQWEAGRGCTSYIKNLNTGVSSSNYITRNSDYLRVAGTDWSNTITEASGRTYSAVLSGRALTQETNAHVLHFKASGAYNGMIIKTNSSNSASDTPYMNAYSTEGLNANVGNFSHNTDFKIAFVQSVAAGGTLGCLNGGSVGSSGTSYITPSQMTIGQYDVASGNFGFNGAVKYVYLFNSDIGTSAMQSLTT